MASNLTIPEIVLDQSIERNSETQAIITAVTASAKIGGVGIQDTFTSSLQNPAVPLGLNSQLSTPLSALALQQSLFAIPIQAAPNSFTATASNNAALRELNNALAAIGLDTANTNKIDGIASLINNFNPAAFLGIAYQLKAQEIATAPANPATPSAAAPIGSLSAAINPLGSAGALNPSKQANTNVALQKLNASLETIGLNRTDINKIDGIASLINNFNPAAFAMLAFQLKAQENAAAGLAATAAPAQIQNPAV